MSKRNIYIAGRFTIRDTLKKLRQRVRDAGHQCVCSWMDQETDAMGTQPNAQWISLARRDIEELKACDTLILDNRGTGGGGRYVELGYALDTATEIIIVGDNYHTIYESLAHRRVQNWDQLMGYLSEQE